MKSQNVLKVLILLLVTIPAAHARSASDCSLEPNKEVVNEIVKNDDLKDSSGIALYRSTIKTSNHLTIHALSEDQLYWSFSVVCDLDHRVLEKGFQECQRSGDFLSAGKCNYQGEFILPQKDGSVKKKILGKAAKLPYVDASGKFETSLGEFNKQFQQTPSTSGASLSAESHPAATPL